MPADAVALALLVLSVSTASVSSMPPEWNLPSMPASWVLNSGGSHRCVRIPASVELCSDIGYTEMRLPNMLNHDTVAEVEEQTRPWLPLAKIACHREIRVLLCSIYAPVCIQQLPDRQIKPCRSLCEAVMRPCAAVMKNFGFSWPEILNCTQFPPDSDLMCIKSSMDLPSKNSSKADCHACPEKVTYESIIGNYCVNKVVFKARIDAISPATGGQTPLRLKRRLRFFKSAGLNRHQKRQLTSVGIETGGGCKCGGLEAARADPTKKFLMMGSASPDGTSVTVSHLVEWQPRNREFKRAMRQIRVAKRHGGAAAVCRVAHLPESLPAPSATEAPDDLATPGGGPKRRKRKNKNKKKNKGKKNRRGDKSGGGGGGGSSEEKKKRRRRNRKNRKKRRQREEDSSGKRTTDRSGSPDASAGAGDRRREQRRRRRQQQQLQGKRAEDQLVSDGGHRRSPSYSYDSFYYRNYHSRAT